MNGPDIDFSTLSNGIRVVHIYNDSPVAYCGILIHTGTRDEEDQESGMAHFIEHTMFKGTTKRNAWHILNRLEDVGGDINAYTEKEETCVYASVLTEDYERAMELCTDIVFNPTFPQKEIDKEKDVIIDEINSYNDSPSELIYDEFETQVFGGKGLGRNVLGSEDILSKYKTNVASRFHSRNYGTDRMLFFSMGNVPEKTLKRLDEKYLSCVKQHSAEAKRNENGIYKVQHIVTEKDLHQVHYLCGGLAYNMFSPKRHAFCLLNNILGGPGLNSRLNLAIRERRGMSYTVESTYTSYTDAGIVNIYFSADPEHKKRCIELVDEELQKLREEKLSDMQLAKAKKQLMGQQAIASENKENLAISIAKCFLYFGKYSTIEERQSIIDQITADEIQEVANEVFDPNKLSSLTYL